jgi:hypothetical protein
MNSFLLFTVSILFLHLLPKVSAFLTRRIPINKNKKLLKNTQLSLVLLSPDPEDRDPKKKKLNLDWESNWEMEIEREMQMKNQEKDPLYTVFWRECHECTKLLQEMEDRGMRTFFVNGEDLFDMMLDEPFICKEEQLLDGWFEIYEELFYERE